MPHRRYILRLLGALLVITGVGACSGGDCPINNTVQGKMVFYDLQGDPVAYTGVLTVSVVRPQGDSVVLNQKAGASEVLFPLSYMHSTDTLVFAYGDGVDDSLYISHTNIPTLVSVDCGTAMYHTITAVSSTHHWIDTLILKSSEVNYDERENIQVIYR
ncbi:MAG: hypothetical protein IKJ18_04535 [Bacteroidaceae bacterium]|nr:hypothetical protein [Bacteroidaceae bacterium]